MHIACRCGQSLAISADRLPHEMCCFACGWKFYLLEDGTKLDMPDAQAVAIQASCRCGQNFSAVTTQFPRQIHCHVCGHRFSVLDTGETLDFDGRGESEARAIAVLVPAAIVEAIPHRQTAPAAQAVWTAESQERFHASRSAALRRARLQLELRLIDLQWQTECCRKFAVFGCTIVPTPRLVKVLRVVALAIIAVTCVLLPTVLVHRLLVADVGLLALMAVGIALAAACFWEANWTGRHVEVYQNLEAAWQRRRDDAIHQFGPLDADE